MTTEEKSRSHWYIGKEIPVATIFMLAVQTLGVVWWAAGMTAKVEALDKLATSANAIQVAVDRKQDDENRRAEERMTSELTKVNLKLDRLIELRMLDARSK